MFLESTDKQKTVIQLKSWLDSLNSNIDSAKVQYDNIVNWLGVIEGNEEYTEEDKLEVFSKLGEAVTKIKTLLPTE